MVWRDLVGGGPGSRRGSLFIFVKDLNADYWAEDLFLAQRQLVVIDLKDRGGDEISVTVVCGGFTSAEQCRTITFGPTSRQHRTHE